jgi:putative ABC transport system permease protein
LQLVARGPAGIPQALIVRVRQLEGVRVAAPLAEANAEAVGTKGSQSVELVGADQTLAQLGGSLAEHSELAPFAGVGAVVLPLALAAKLGVTRFGQEVRLNVAGRAVHAPLYAALGREKIGPLANVPMVIAPLFYAQEMTGMQGRVSRILVEVSPGDRDRVRAALQRLGGEQASVQSTAYDEQLFSVAAQATNQSTVLFAVISALVGFLFAFNAVLLTVSQRRRLLADLRREGYGALSVTGVMLVDAAVLACAASMVGLLLGEELSLHLFQAAPGYLSSGFAVGAERVVSTRDVLVAVAGGAIAATVAVLAPLRSVLSRGPLAVASEPGAGSIQRIRLSSAGVMCLAAATAILLVSPKLAVVGIGLLVAAMLFTLPLALDAVLAIVRRLAPAFRSAVPHVALMELGAGKTRAVAVAATGAIAVFGSVAIETAHSDLARGLESAASEMNASTDVWVSPSGSFNLLKTTAFGPGDSALLDRLRGVRAVRVYRGTLLDWGKRRIWVIAPPAAAQPLLPQGQLLEGDPARASEEVRRGGWAVVSRALASEHELRLGSPFTAPSPRPTRLRVAAISTNIGWPPGAMIMSAEQFAQAWQSTKPSAYNILAEPGTSPRSLANEARRALGPSSGLSVETAQAHASEQRALARQGLVRLTQIATLILIAAVLAMAAAMGSMVWQRRPRLAKLKLEGFARAMLWRTIVLESALLLGAGCVAGAAFGLYGQALLDRALAEVIGFPVFYSFGGLIALASFTVVTASAVLIVAVPGSAATGVSPALALQD